MADIMSRQPLFVRTTAWMLIFCLALMLNGTTSYCAPASTEKTSTMTPEEKRELVEKAVKQYEKKKLDKAREGLELAEKEFPENFAVPYYLGLIYLEQGNVQGAITQWQRYVELDPNSENAQNIRKNITLLLHQEAKEFAKKAMASEADLAGAELDQQTIAVTNFRNLGSESLGPLGKGIAAMIITDLSHVPDLKVVDRIKMHVLLKEMDLGKSGLVGAKSVPKFGKLLKAKHVTSGSLADLDKEKLVIASAVMDTEKAASIGAQEGKGELVEFYDLQKKISCEIIEDLGRECASLPEDFNKIHTRQMPALLAYSQGLDYIDEENYDQARDKFQEALDHDPEFELAAIALSATPTSAMASKSNSQMISDASTSGVSSGAGTAVAGSSASETYAATASTASAGSVGFAPSTMAMIGGGVLVGGLALAGGGGGGGGGGDPKPGPASLSLTGDWRGSWEDASGKRSDTVLSLTQNKDNTVKGKITVSDDKCIKEGDISGKVSGAKVDLTLKSGGEAVTMDGNASKSSKTLNGTWNFTSSSSGCKDASGKFSTTLTTGVTDVHW